MKNFKYCWNNCGQMLLGYDIAKFTIELQGNNFQIWFTTGEIRGITILDKIYKVDSEKILSELSKVQIPEQYEDNNNGCDGSSWELTIDDKILKGYLNKPEWLEKIKDIIEFTNIYKYINTKRDLYLGTKAEYLNSLKRK